MDVFSAGCVIAELLMDGEKLFEPATLQSYRKDAFDPGQVLHKRVEDPALVNLVLHMIEREPAKRPTIHECLQLFDQEALP